MLPPAAFLLDDGAGLLSALGLVVRVTVTVCDLCSSAFFVACLRAAAEGSAGVFNSTRLFLGDHAVLM